jgi:hypothetical protein
MSKKTILGILAFFVVISCASENQIEQQCVPVSGDIAWVVSRFFVFFCPSFTHLIFLNFL